MKLQHHRKIFATGGAAEKVCASRLPECWLSKADAGHDCTALGGKVSDPGPRAMLRGEPSYVWRAGQQRRLQLILAHTPALRGRTVLVDGCGVGTYVQKLREQGAVVHGLDIEFARVQHPVAALPALVCGACEALPYPSGSFDVVLSHEVLEHVQNDRQAMRELVRVLRPGGRAVIFAPNRWYPFETHGVHWRGRYRFGNAPLVNYLPDVLRNKLAGHVRAYTARALRALQLQLPVTVVAHTLIFGGYDNLVARWGTAGSALRSALQALEHTPLRAFGLSHFMVLKKTE